MTYVPAWGPGFRDADSQEYEARAYMVPRAWVPFWLLALLWQEDGLGLGADDGRGRGWADSLALFALYKLATSSKDNA